MSAFTVSIDLSTFALPVTVRGTYFAGTPARTAGPVENCDPGENEELDIESITVDGVSIPLRVFSDEAMEKVNDLCYYEIKDEQKRQDDDAAISRYEDAKEDRWL